MNEKTFVATLRAALKEREEWTDKAHCHGLWEIFDLDYDKGRYEDEIPIMRKICGNCPVREQCLEDSLLYSDEMTFRAGLKPSERLRLQQKTTGFVAWETKQKMLKDN